MEGISEKTLRRMPKYLHYLRGIVDHTEVISAARMAEDLDIHHTQIRKDLAMTGVAGQPKVGHRTAPLIKAIEQFLGWNNTTDAFLVGAGNLGRALIGYQGFQKNGIRIIAAFDTDPSLTGGKVRKVDVFPLEKLPNLTARLHVQIGILTTPAEAAQKAAELMVGSGIKALWNFAPVKLAVPPGIIVVDAELYSSLAVLSRKLIEQTT
jgi:redox-sensing transcriptional repressor